MRAPAATFLLGQSVAGQRGSRAAGVALAGYVAPLFSCLGVDPWSSGPHSHDEA